MAGGEYSLRYIPADSPVHRLYPLTKVAWVLVVAVGLFVFKSPLSGAIMLAAVLLVALAGAGISLRNLLNSSALIFGLGILLMLFHFFADPGQPIYRIGPLAVTDGGLRQGPVFFFRLSVIVLASFVLIWTTDPRDLMVSLSKAGMPYRYAFAVFLAMRFLPLIQREVDAVRSAHAIRGRAARSSLVHRVRLWQRYMFTILVNGLRKAEAAATALDCRAFGAYPVRTYVKDVTFSARGLLLVLAFAVLWTALIVVERVY